MNKSFEGKGGLSSRKVCDLVNNEYGTDIKPRSVQRYVKDGLAGQSPKKNGSPGAIEKFIWNSLCAAFESHVKINQLNGKGGENSRKKLAARVNQAMGKQFDKIEYSLLNRLLKVTASDLLGGKATGAEERRIRWTSFRNLNQWFDNWGRDLVQLGFAHMEGNEIIIPTEQLARIVNVDETCLALDGGSGIRGGILGEIFLKLERVFPKAAIQQQRSPGAQRWERPYRLIFNLQQLLSVMRLRDCDATFRASCQR